MQHTRPIFIVLNADDYSDLDGDLDDDLDADLDDDLDGDLLLIL